MKRSIKRATTLPGTPLTITQLDELFAFLDSVLARTGCDNTLLITKRWLSDRGHDTERVVGWLQQRGGYCDCEVLFNVEPRVKGE